MQRRLAAILAADVVGYSRLMGTDEMGTLTSLKSHRRELVDSGIAEHRGRIVKTTGDGMLVEFASAVDAVGCGVKIQRAMVERNAAVPSDKRIEFRVGINLDEAGTAASRVLTAANLKQDIRYCKASDGVRLAYATVGEGPPLLKSAH